MVTKHFIQWQKFKNRSVDDQLSEIIKHWESRYELGTAMLICDDPKVAAKYISKQWRKLTQQAQKVRETKNSAEDILRITRTISRMQRVKFSVSSPDVNQHANFYVTTHESMKVFPTNCYTLYVLGPVLKTIDFMKLAPGALVVAYQEKVDNLAGMLPKSILGEQLQVEEESLVSWLKEKDINLDALEDDMDQTNEALDMLLSQSRLQEEFLYKTKYYLFSLNIAQPITLDSAQQRRLRSLLQLEHHIKILSPTYVSDRLLDSSSEDSFLLRDILNIKAISESADKEVAAKQRLKGRNNLAGAIERKSGFITL